MYTQIGEQLLFFNFDDQPKVDISIVIVNYKSWGDLQNCLNSLTSIQSNKISFEIIVVDNCSSDGQLDRFVAHFPNVFFIQNSGNNGFAHANNVGTTCSKGNYFLFLNPDTLIPDANVLEELFQVATEYPDFGILSCTQKNESGKKEKTIRSFPNMVNLFGIIRAMIRLFKQNIQAENSDFIETDWVSGSAVFMSKNWFNKINGWTEDYWMYYEDVDLSKKVHNLGGKVVVLSHVHLIHNHGGASRINVKTTALTKSELIKSRHTYFRNHFTGFYRLLCQFLLVSSILTSKFFLAVLGLLFYIIPKLRAQLLIFIRLVEYYIHCVKYRIWLSQRSMNFKKKH